MWGQDRKPGSVLRQIIEKWRGKDRAGTPRVTAPLLDHGEIVAGAIYHREHQGLTTTLRHLHKISDLTQSEALKAVSNLEHAGLVVVSHDTNDAFESVVSLTPGTRARLTANSRRNAA